MSISDAKQMLKSTQGAWVLLRYKDASSNKFYGLSSEAGTYSANYGRYNATNPSEVSKSAGRISTLSSLEVVLSKLSKKLSKGYEIFEMGYNYWLVPKIQIAGREILYIMPKSHLNLQGMWGAYDKEHELLCYIPSSTTVELADKGILLSGLFDFG